MAFFDQLGNLTPDQNQALLSAASQILQASGPSRTPTSIGQILGGGLQAYQQGLQGAEDRNYQNQVRALQLQELKGSAADKERARQEAEGLRQFYVNRAAQAGSPLTQAQSVLGNNLAPTQANADTLAAAQAAQSPQAPPSIYQQRLAEAQALRGAGYHAQADAAEKAALAFAPKVKDFKEVQVNGRTLYAPLFEDGTAGKPVQYDAAVKLAFQNTGGQTVGLNPFTGQQVASLTNTATPGELLTAQTARNRLSFDKQQAGENGTGPLTQQAIDNAAKRYNFDGTLPSMGMGKSAAAGRSLILNRAAELAGGESATGGREEQLANKGNIASQSAAVKAFTSGKQGNTIRSFNTSVAHLDTLGQLADQLNNTSSPTFNKVANFYQQQTGNPAPTSFNAAKKIVGDEIVKAIVGAGGGVADREEAAKTIDAANSPAQLKNVIKTYQELMVGQLGGLEQQYKASTNRSDFNNLLSGRAKEIYQQTHGASATGQQKTATLADIAETARSSGRSTAEVTARLKALGYKIGGE